MKMRVDYPAKLATVTLDEDETQIDIPALDLMTRKAMDEPVGLMALELIAPASDMNSEALQKRGFVIAGSVSRDTVTFLKFRKRLGSPSFSDTPRPTYCPSHNPDLATAAPVLQRTPAEVSALKGLDASLERHYSPESVERRLAQIAEESAKFKSPKSESVDIAAKAQRLAAATVTPAEG